MNPSEHAGYEAGNRKRSSAVLPVAVVGMSGPLLFWTILLVSQWLHPGYDAWVDSISRLIFGKYGWLQTMNFYLLTLFSAAFGILMYISVARSVFGRVGSILLAIMGIAQLLTAVFQVDVNPSGPNSLAYVTHKMVFIVSVGSFPFGALLLVPDLRQDKRWRSFAYVSLGAAFAVMALGLVWLVSQPIQPHFIDPWFGAYERALLSIPLAWMIAMSAQALSVSRRSQHSRQRD